MLATNEMLEMWSKVKDIYIDGTFSAVPHCVEQSYNIMGAIDQGDYNVVPIAIILMKKRNKEAYLQAFSKLYDLIPGEKPVVSSVHTDCEPGAIKAFLRVSFKW